MITEITVYFYKDKNKTIFKEINIESSTTEQKFIFDENVDDIEKETRKMKNILISSINRLKNETGLSFKELTERKIIKFKNIEIMNLNDKIDTDDDYFYRNSLMFCILMSMGCFKGTLPFYLMISGFLCQIQNYIEYKLECKNNNKKMEKLSKKYNVKCNRLKSKIRKLVFYMNLLLHLTISNFLILNKVNEYHQNLYNTQVEIFNPLDDENIDNLTDDEINRYIYEAIDNNSNISNTDKKIIENIDEYAMDSDYIDYGELYKDLSTVRIYDFDKYIVNGNLTTIASYDETNNIINRYGNDTSRRRSDTLHEFIHSTGRFESRFLNEGMTAIIEREYYENNNPNEAYTRNVNTIRLLCELVGPDIVLEAFNTRNDDLLYNELAKIYGDYDYAKNTINKLDEIEKYIRYCDNNLFKWEVCGKLTKGLSSYIENSNNKDQINLNYYLESIVYDYDVNEIYYFNTEKNKNLDLKLDDK